MKRKTMTGFQREWFLEIYIGDAWWETSVYPLSCLIRTQIEVSFIFLSSLFFSYHLMLNFDDRAEIVKKNKRSRGWFISISTDRIHEKKGEMNIMKRTNNLSVQHEWWNEFRLVHLWYSQCNRGRNMHDCHFKNSHRHRENPLEKKEIIILKQMRQIPSFLRRNVRKK